MQQVDPMLCLSLSHEYRKTMAEPVRQDVQRESDSIEMPPPCVHTSTGNE